MSLINGTRVEVLNLEKIFVNYFSGGWDIFFFVAMIFFAYLSAKFRMSNYIFLMITAVFVVFMANYYSMLYGLAILMVGFIFFYLFERILK